jgi:hypothetical protein
MRISKRFSFLAHPMAFFISAIGHELVVGIPMHTVEGWAFWVRLFKRWFNRQAMMAQVPLVWVSERMHELEMAYRQYRRQRDTQTTPTESDTELSPTSSTGGAVGSPLEEHSHPREYRLGNYLFWISFCLLGQPVCLLLYYRSWYLKQYGEPQ